MKRVVGRVLRRVVVSDVVDVRIGARAIGLRGRKKRVVGRRLQRVVVSDVVDLRIGARVMALVCLARLGGFVPAHVTRQRRWSRRLVCDLARMSAAIISGLGTSRFASVNLTMGRVSSMGGVVPAHITRKRRQARRVVWDLAGIGAAVISELGARRVAASVSLTMGRVSSMGGVISGQVIRERRQARRIVWDLAGIGAAVISELGASRVAASVSLTMGGVSSMGGVVPARVIRKRRQARRVVWDLAGIGAAVISELGASRVAASVNLTMGRVSSMGGVVPARVIRKRRQARRVVWDLAGIGAAVISELGAS